MQRLKEAAEKAKKELSSSQTTNVNLPFITVNSTGLIKETVKSGSAHEELIPVDEWLFSADRKAGDYKYFVLDDEGLSIYYFEGTGKPVWLANVDKDMRSDDLQKKLDSFKETYPVTINEKAIAKIS